MEKQDTKYDCTNSTNTRPYRISRTYGQCLYRFS